MFSGEISKKPTPSILSLEKTLKNLEETYRKTPTSKTEAAKNAAKSALSSRLQLIKTLTSALEQTNTSHLIFFRSTKGFYKIIDRTAIFYAYDLATRLNRRFTIYPDTDHYARSEIGTISFKNLPQLENQLRTLQIHRAKSLKNFPIKNAPDPAAFCLALKTEDIIIFALNETYTSTQIATFTKKAHTDLTKTINTIAPENPIPELFIAIRDLNDRLFHTLKHIQDPLLRNAIIIPTIETSKNLLQDYINYANNHAPSRSPSEALINIAKIPINSRKRLNLFYLIQDLREIKHAISYLTLLRALEPSSFDKIQDTIVIAERLANAAFSQESKKCKTGSKNS